MELRELNKKIKARDNYYHEAAQRINDKHNKMWNNYKRNLGELRMFAVQEIFKLKDKDRTMIKYEKRRRELRNGK